MQQNPSTVCLYAMIIGHKCIGRNYKGRNYIFEIQGTPPTACITPTDAQSVPIAAAQDLCNDNNEPMQGPVADGGLQPLPRDGHVVAEGKRTFEWALADAEREEMRLRRDQSPIEP